MSVFSPLNASSVGELNNAVFSVKVAELVCVDEAIQFQIIHQIVDAVDRHAHRVVFLAGSSSSGKSVVSSRLRTLLAAKGYATEVVSTDSYYRNLADDDYPRFPNGSKNCDTVDALRVPLLLEQLQRLISPSVHTGTMQIPTFDLGTGTILKGTRPVTVPLASRGVVVSKVYSHCAQKSPNPFAVPVSTVEWALHCVMIHQCQC